MSAGAINREGFAALVPLRAGHREVMRETLRALAPGGDSPFSRLAGTHFARLTLVALPEVPFCLLFAAEFDRPTRDYLEALPTALSEQADTIFGGCIGYPGSFAPAAFADWMLKHRVPAGFSVHANPGATADEVETSLDLRERIIAFALETRDLEPAALRQRWAEQDWETPG
ncbi:MAG: hypothetical protein ACXWEE_00820 [Thermoleophilaceae bacterium]